MKQFITAGLMLIASIAYANDLTLSTASLTGQDVTAGANNVANFTFIQFDVNWSNSWRTSTGPNNWDAAWIFVKYQVNSGTGCTVDLTWRHATLSNNSGHHSVTNTNGVAASFSAAADGTGVFVYRSADGSGSIDWDQVLLRWNYGADGILDACNVTVRVYAIEMVYVPQGSFFAGDGAFDRGQFESAISGSPYQFTSEASINLGGGGAGSMGNNNRNGQTAGTVVDDFNDATTVVLPAAFPKGFAAFYTMKYEITQEQYVEFLNVLTPTQQLARHGATAVNQYFTGAATPPNRNGVRCRTLPVVLTNILGVYACDLNNNGVFNQTADGQNLAMPHLSGMDLMAYWDWSGLRPMTELELEKACRGPLPSVLNEHAWGSSSLYATSYAALTNAGAGNELPNSPSTTVGNSVYSTTANVVGIQGPMRVGIFATATSSRVVAGASYYGVMEMSGNVWEVVVGVGHVAGRSFTGLHGNGSISTAGFANVDFWPGASGNSVHTTANGSPNTGSTQAVGLMFRGGSYLNTQWLRVSDRDYSGWNGLNTRDNRMGGRGVRTAP
jgi:formylglycine-generating enzyme required for sulfatase activity